MANDIPIETYKGVQIYSLGAYSTPYYFTTLNRIKSQSRTIRGVRNWIDKYLAKKNPGITEGHMISLHELASQIGTGKLQEGLSREQEQKLVDWADDAGGIVNDADEIDGYVLDKVRKDPIFKGVSEKDISEFLNREY